MVRSGPVRFGPVRSGLVYDNKLLQDAYKCANGENIEFVMVHLFG